MKSQKTQKVVQVIARYFIKRNHAVVYSVRSSNGADTYCTTIINGKATGCTCPATKPCYHMVQLEVKEAARKEAEKQTSDAQYIEQLEAMAHYDVNAVASKIVAGVLIGDAYEVRDVELVQSLAQIRREAEETAAAYYRMSFMPY